MSSAGRLKSGTPSRLEPRYSAYRELAVTYEGHNDEIPVRTPDLSTRGIFINTVRSFPEGAVLSVQFRLNRTDIVIRARGEVRYCLPGVGVGVEFIEISPESIHAIEEEMSSAMGSFQSET